MLKNIQEFVVEMGLYEVFGEVHEVDKNDIDGTFEYGTKCVDYVITDILRIYLLHSTLLFYHTHHIFAVFLFHYS